MKERCFQHFHNGFQRFKILRDHIKIWIYSSILKRGKALTTLGPCARLVFFLQLGSFIHLYQPPSPHQNLHLRVPFVLPCTTTFCSGHRMTLLGLLTQDCTSHFWVSGAGSDLPLSLLLLALPQNLLPFLHSYLISLFSLCSEPCSDLSRQTPYLPQPQVSECCSRALTRLLCWFLSY